MGRPLSLRDSLPGLGRLTRRFWPYVRRERPLIMVSLLALYAEIVLRLLEPWPLKWVLDRVAGVTRHRGFSRLPFLDALDPAMLLALSAVAVIVFAGLRALAAYYNTVGFALVGNRVLTTVRNELYGQLQRLSLSFHTRARSGDLLVRVTGDVGFLQDAAVLWYGARLALRGVMTPGDLVVFLAYLKNAFRPVRDFVKYTGRLAKASAAGERVLDLLDRTPDVRDLPGAVPAPALRGAVRFDGVTFSYEPGLPALEQIDCVLQPGQRVALVGPSGSGKSTFASLILRLYDPTAGRVLIDERDIREYTLASLRAQMSVVLQDSLLFAATIRDNIAYGAPGTPHEAIEAAARLANAHAFVEALPKGYDTMVGERGVTLSNGQRQRIAIARAAIRRAPVLILDEPTTGLDGENERAVIEALERLAEGRTTFLITHDLLLAGRADLVLYLEAGRVREWGTHAQLLQAGGQYALLYHLQTAGGGRGTTPQRYDAVTT